MTMLFGNNLANSSVCSMSVLVLHMLEKKYLLCIPMSAMETNQRTER